MEYLNEYSVTELKCRIAELYREMEQVAEPEGGPVCDEYADAIDKHERALRKKQPTKKPMTYDEAINPKNN